MGIRQLYKDDSEEKKYYLSDNFIGGVNTVDADDVVSDISFRKLINWQDDIRGVLVNRRGIKPYDLLDSLLIKSIGRKIPNYTEYIKILNDSDKLLEYYFSQYSDIEKLITDADGKFLTILVAYDQSINDVRYGFLDFIKIEVKNNDIFVTSMKQALPDNKSTGKINTLEMGSTILIRFGNQLMAKMELNEIGNPVYTWFNIAMNSVENPVYKPTPLEIRKIGFNVLAYSPLTYIDKQGISEKTIQGIYITSSEDVPALYLPLNSTFRLFIMYTGTISDFTIAFKDGENTLTATSTKNTTLSNGGLMVYDVTFKDIAITEVEIDISVTGDTSVGVYRDFYSVGTNTNNQVFKKVNGLDISGFENIPYFGRTLYYSNKELWFSELNRLDYVPNYNYVILDIDYDDELIAVTYFRKSYIIWTKKRIFKMSGAFGSSDFTIELVNDYIGCINKNTIRYVENNLVFLSSFGLYRLKTDKFSPNMENIEKLDKVVRLDIKSEDVRESFLYDNKYILFYRDEAVIYKYENGTFLFNKFSISYDKIFSSNGKIYLLNEGSLLQYDAENYYKDGNLIIPCTIRTVSNNLEYPTHVKKIKSIIMKMKHGGVLVPVYVYMYADGYLTYTPEDFEAIINENREVEYIETTDPTLRLAPNKIILGQALLGENKLGGTDFTVHKLNYTAKCKNVYFDIIVYPESSIELHSIGYTYRLGKIKE